MKNIRWSPGANECSITAAGTPVGTAEYVREKEALAIAEKHQDRLDRLADFAEHGEDGPRDFGKDFTTVGTRHLGLTLLDYRCKHRFDYVTHLSSKEILGEGLIEHVQRSIHSCFSRICDGEIHVRCWMKLASSFWPCHSGMVAKPFMTLDLKRTSR